MSMREPELLGFQIGFRTEILRSTCSGPEMQPAKYETSFEFCRVPGFRFLLLCRNLLCLWI